MKRKKSKQEDYNVRVVIIDDNNRTLLLGRWNSKDKYRLEYPGGNVDGNDSDKKTGRKETKQESGLSVIIGKRTHTYTNPENGVKNVFHYGKLAHPDQRIRLEDGFTRAVWIHLGNYSKWNYCPSAFSMTKRLIKRRELSNAYL